MIKNLVELNKKHERNWKAYLNREKKIEKEIERLTKEKSKLRFQSGIRKLFNPIAEKIKNKLNAKEITWYGPFGLSSSQTIYFLKDKDNLDICKRGNVLGSITFVHNRDGYAIRDESKNTKDYANGTLGEMNGFNHPSVEFTEKMNINWLVKWAKRGR